MEGRRKKRKGVDEKGFFSHWGKSKKGLSMTPIFSVVGKEGGEEGKKKGGKEERVRRGGEGGEGEKKGFLFGRKGLKDKKNLNKKRHKHNEFE